MSRKERSKSNSDEDTNSSDSSIDVTSPNFDPLKALYASKMKIPVKNAPKFDNVASYVSKMKANTLGVPVGKTASDKAAEEKRRQEDLAVKNARRFQPHQMPIQCKREFVNRNLLTRIENMTGPLARLKSCMDSRLRIKVITRNEKGIRGYCIGYLQAFDKLWNLAMTDVTEVWTRKKKKKVPAAIESYELSEDLRKKLSLHRPTPPKIVVKSAGKGFESCERHVPQLMMRGEHVVLISILQSNEPPVASTSKDLNVGTREDTKPFASKKDDSIIKKEKSEDRL